MNAKRNSIMIFWCISMLPYVLIVKSTYSIYVTHYNFFGYSQKSSKPNRDATLAKYIAAYEYITTNDTAVKQIVKTLKTVQKIKKNARITYCIDSVAQPLIISGFGAIKDTELRAKIRLIEIGKVPIELIKRSICINEKASFNLTFSILNESYMTAEVSARFLNPLGGSTKGPSIKYLFFFDDNNLILRVLHQEYLNG